MVLFFYPAVGVCVDPSFWISLLLFFDSLFILFFSHLELITQGDAGYEMVPCVPWKAGKNLMIHDAMISRVRAFGHLKDSQNELLDFSSSNKTLSSYSISGMNCVWFWASS